METLNNIVLTIQNYMSNYILVIALLGAGLWFSIRLGFIQVRGFGESMRRTFGGLFSKKGEAGADGMSSFQALATAIAAQVGTGNIAGAATALAIGGPGAIFWMWIAAFLGMATIYAEAIMAQKYKTVGADGQVTGGPVYYIRAAFKGTFGKVLAGIFAILITLALGFMGNAVQSNSIAASFHTAFGIPQWIMGLVVAVIAIFVFMGGMKRIAKVTETIVPFMAALYIIGSLIVIIYNYKNIPYAFASIFIGAFSPSSVVGGAAGGVGIFTVQLAQILGAKVIGTASGSTADFLQDLGAEQISYGPGLADRLKNKEITAAIDLFSHETLKAALELGVKADKMSTVIMYPEPPAGIPTATGGEALPSDMEMILNAISNHQLTVPIAAKYSIDDYLEAINLQMNRHAHGKIVLYF